MTLHLCSSQNALNDRTLGFDSRQQQGLAELLPVRSKQSAVEHKQRPTEWGW